MKLSEVHEAAKQSGYAGKPDDLPAIRAHMEAHKAQYDYVPDDWGKVEIEDDTSTKKFSIPKSVAPPKQAELPPDWEAKAKALIEEATKGLRAENKGGPGVPNPEVTVKGATEREWELRKSHGDSCFGSFDSLYGYHQYLKCLTGGLWHDYGMAGRKSLGEWASRNKLGDDFAQKAFFTNVPTQGAPLIPDIFVPDLINLVNEFGAAQRLFTPIPMAGPQLVWPRMTSRLTMYYPLEGSAPTQSDLAFNNVNMKSHDGMVLSRISQQALDDSSIGLADVWTREALRSCASGIDDAVFVGDGTGAFGTITGIARKFGTAASTTGYAATGGTTTDAHTATHIVDALSRLPSYARAAGGIKFTCTPQIQDGLFTRLSQSVPGGLVQRDILGVGTVFTWMGYPIITNEKMNSRWDASTGTNPTGFTAADDIDFIVGNFNLAGKFGIRKQVELAMDTSLGFDTYSVYMRAVVRFDFQLHDPGSTTAANSLVALWQT